MKNPVKGLKMTLYPVYGPGGKPMTDKELITFLHNMTTDDVLCLSPDEVDTANVVIARITQLLAELSIEQGYRTAAEDELERLKAENERQRKALAAHRICATCRKQLSVAEWASVHTCHDASEDRP